MPHNQVLKNLLIFGKDGQLGHELVRAFQPLAHVVPLGREDCDITDGEALGRVIQVCRPAIIINAAAFTDVERAQHEAVSAVAVNALAVGCMAAQARRSQALLVHFSSDYIFSGDCVLPYSEHDAAGPLSVYGRSKLAGEQAVRANCGDHLIIRTGWVYSARRNNFVKKILSALAAEKDISVVTDQAGTPTSAALIAGVMAQILAPCLAGETRAFSHSGTFHLSAKGSTTRYEWARYIARAAQSIRPDIFTGDSRVAPALTSAKPGAACRPQNSVLDTAKLQQTFGISFPPWQDDVQCVIKQLLAARDAQQK